MAHRSACSGTAGPVQPPVATCAHAGTVRTARNARLNGRADDELPALHRGLRAAVPPAPCRERLSDEDFWRLSVELSEPPGASMHSDNLVSNERSSRTPCALRAPRRRVHRRRPRAELQLHREARAGDGVRDRHPAGVPRPASALQGALRSVGRSREFVSRLFSRELPQGVRPRAPARRVCSRRSPEADRRWPSRRNRHAGAPPARRRASLAADARDLASIDYAPDAFYSGRPGDSVTGRSRPGSEPSGLYRTLMTARDVAACTRSYLATETFSRREGPARPEPDRPVVGDFGGPAPHRASAVTSAVTAAGSPLFTRRTSRST